MSTFLTPATQSTHPERTLLAEQVSSLRGICHKRGGNTPEDVLDEFPILNSWTGLELVLLWDFDDCWGLGGNSEYCTMVPGKSGLYEAPSKIFEFLWDDAGREISPDVLRGLKPGQYLRGSTFYHSVDPANWCRRRVDGEAD